jgi:hypothetical protein
MKSGEVLRLRLFSVGGRGLSRTGGGSPLGSRAGRTRVPIAALGGRAATGGASGEEFASEE